MFMYCSREMFSVMMFPPQVPQDMEDVGGMPLNAEPELPRLFGWRTMIRETGAQEARRSMWESSQL